MDSVVGMVTGVGQMIAHPIDTASGLAQAARHPILTAELLADEMAQKSGTLRGQGELAGDLIGTLAGGAVGAKAAAKAKTVANAGRARLAAKAAAKADDTGRARKIDIDPDLEDFGSTAPNGDISIAPGLSKEVRHLTLRHELVHSFLSVSDEAAFAAIRQNLSLAAYNRSAFFNAAEEIIAESIAAGSIRAGLKHAFGGDYELGTGTVVTPGLVLTEIGIGSVGLAGAGYGANQLGNWLFGSDE